MSGNNTDINYVIYDVCCEVGDVLFVTGCAKGHVVSLRWVVLLPALKRVCVKTGEVNELDFVSINSYTLEEKEEISFLYPQLRFPRLRIGTPS